MFTNGREMDIGAETLRRMRVVTRYNDWIFKKIQPFIGKRILEVGSGIGNFSEKLVDFSEFAVLTDCEKKYLSVLEERFKNNRRVKIFNFDLNSSKPQIEVLDIDTVICLNVLEHVKDEGNALEQFRRILVPGGRVILQLPAHESLYGTLDNELDHFRRYSRKGTKLLMEKHDYIIEALFFFNMFGVPGWLLNSRVLKRSILPEGQLHLYNILAPFFEAVEKVITPLFGLSLFCIVRKKHT